MLYKVTPMMAPPEKAAKKPRQPGEPRKKRKSAVYDHEGNEVLITLMCLKCRQIKPLVQFGLRKMADGAIRNQPWCRQCRSGAGVPKPKAERAPESAAAPAAAEHEVETIEVEAASDVVPETPAHAEAEPAADSAEAPAAPVDVSPA
jgi:hypothetical protein